MGFFAIFGLSTGDLSFVSSFASVCVPDFRSADVPVAAPDSRKYRKLEMFQRGKENQIHYNLFITWFVITRFWI